MISYQFRKTTKYEMTNKVDIDFPSIVKRYESSLKSPTEDHFKATIRAIDDVFKYTLNGSLTERKVAQSLIDHWYTRLASSLTYFFVQPREKISGMEVQELTFRKQEIYYIFAASGYRSTNHFATLMTGSINAGEATISYPNLVLLLSIISIDDAQDELIEHALKLDPQILFYLMIGWLNQRSVLSEQGERNRTTLLAAHSRIKNVQVTEQQFQFMIKCWMYCSYATYPKKHDMKETLNQLFTTRMREAGLLPKPPIYRKKERPRMLVINERFRSGHAMHRCFKNIIAPLNQKFELISLAEKTEIDAESAKIFDRSITFSKKELILQKTISTIEKLKPDCIFYPSVGMSLWTTLLANLRLAPIQFMMGGHPATTRSKEMDYILKGPSLFDDTNVFSEKVIEYQIPDSNPHQPHPLLNSFLEKSSKLDYNPKFRIAINSKVMKLSYRLLDICKKLQVNSEKEIEFVFFPGEKGLYLDGIKQLIKTHLPDAEVHGFLQYDSFLRVIHTCSLSLAAFPFGNTNSTVDSCLLGIPTVCHLGPEPPSQTDRTILARAGFPNELVCQSDEEYYQRALQIINDDTYRDQLLQKISRSTNFSLASDQDKPAHHAELAEVFISAYRSEARLKYGG